MSLELWGWIILALSLLGLLIPAYRNAVRKRNRYRLGKPWDDPRSSLSMHKKIISHE